jgi:hypothetical protein
MSKKTSMAAWLYCFFTSQGWSRLCGKKASIGMSSALLLLYSVKKLGSGKEISLWGYAAKKTRPTYAHVTKNHCSQIR